MSILDTLFAALGIEQVGHQKASKGLSQMSKMQEETAEERQVPPHQAVLPRELIAKIVILSFDPVHGGGQTPGHLRQLSRVRLVNHEVLDIVGLRSLHRRTQVALVHSSRISRRLLRQLNTNSSRGGAELAQSIALQRVRRLRIDQQGGDDISTSNYARLLDACETLVALELVALRPSVASVVDYSNLRALSLDLEDAPASLDLSGAQHLRFLELSFDAGLLHAPRLPSSLVHLQSPAWQNVDLRLLTKLETLYMTFDRHVQDEPEHLEASLALREKPLRQLVLGNHGRLDNLDVLRLNLHNVNTLEELDLAVTGVENPSALCLDKLSRLARLDISGNALTTIRVVDLASNNTLTHLDLSYVQSSCWADDLPVLARQLRINTTLKVLLLKECFLSDADVAGFSIGAEDGGGGLKELDLCGNSLTDEGMRALQLQHVSRIDVWVGVKLDFGTDNDISPALEEELFKGTGRRMCRTQWHGSLLVNPPRVVDVAW